MRIVYTAYIENFNMNASFHSTVWVCLRLCGQTQIEMTSVSRTEVLRQGAAGTKWRSLPPQCLAWHPNFFHSDCVAVNTHLLVSAAVPQFCLYLWGQLDNCPTAVAWSILFECETHSLFFFSSSCFSKINLHVLCCWELSLQVNYFYTTIEFLR